MDDVDEFRLQTIIKQLEQENQQLKERVVELETQNKGYHSDNERLRYEKQDYRRGFREGQDRIKQLRQEHDQLRSRLERYRNPVAEFELVLSDNEIGTYQGSLATEKGYCQTQYEDYENTNKPLRVIVVEKEGE